MNKVIIYCGKYGNAKAYANELSKRVNIECFSYYNFENFKDYDVIIYIGSLYNGGVLGLTRTISMCKKFDNIKEFILVTVGMSDPKLKENKEKIENSIRVQIRSDFINKTTLFSVRGGINYDVMSDYHREIMDDLYDQIRALPDEDKNPETKTIIETYGKNVDFINFDDLKPIEDKINSL